MGNYDRFVVPICSKTQKINFKTKNDRQQQIFQSNFIRNSLYSIAIIFILFPNLVFTQSIRRENFY